MFPIKRIEKLHQELNDYYLQVIAFQDKDLQYQNIANKFFKDSIRIRWYYRRYPKIQ
jgi:hypothetical protein